MMGVALAAAAGNASALEFEIADTTISLDNLFTVGAAWRMQDRDPSLIGKSNVTPGICVRRTNGENFAGPSQTPEDNSYEGDTCKTSDLASNEAYVKAPGSFSPNGDNGDLNFDKGNLTYATAKLTTDLNFEVYDFNVFLRGIVFFDKVYNDLVETHPDTTLQPRHNDYPDAQQDVNAFSLDLLDANVSRNFEVFDRFISVKLGKQVLNWGESALLFLNSLNTINPPDARRARIPGFDLKEAFQPLGMLTVNMDVIENVGLEMFYGYDWEPVVADPVGSFLSQTDLLGAGGDYAMLSFGKAPEDPDCLYRPYLNPDDPTAAVGSTACRTIYVDKSEPDEMGQYGFALKSFLENFNNGTELNFYFANYHSRLPVVSAYASDATCLTSLVEDFGLNPNPAINFANLIAACGVPPGNVAAIPSGGPYDPADGEVLPVNTVRGLIEYPRNIQMYGVSFNTTIGDYALSGEYAFRPNLPVQIHSTDLIFAALQPAFPEEDVNLGVAVLPSRRSAVPDFLTQYRRPGCGANCIRPNQYIRGYEEMKVGQLGLTLLRLIGGDNPIGASQMTILFETGMTHVLDMPGLDELQFNGGGTDTHISHGADGTRGISPSDVRAEDGQNNDPDDGDPCATASSPVATAEDTNPRCLRQNPTAHADHDGFGSEYSFGYRLINLNRWDSALFGANLETLFIARHDVSGTAPGIGTNFTQGRKEFNLGLRWDYLSTWIGEVRYTWHTGGGKRDGVRDRDNIFVTAGYLF